MTQSVTRVIAEYAANTSIDRIPEAARERAKQVILDEMASACFGARSLGGGLAAAHAAAQGSREEAAILGTNLRASAPLAALANGSSGHGEEVDGAHVIGGHPGATLVHAAVALAERQRASGAELVNAVVLGYDVGVRLVEACGGKFTMKKRYRLYSDFLYALGAAAAGCRLLGLDPNRHCHALALATFQTNALSCLYQEKRHISKSFCNGQFAHAGVNAALMAASGFEGVENVLETRDGLFEAWGVEGAAEKVTRELGTDWSIFGANFKFINAGYPIHAGVEAVTSAVRDNGLELASIESIHIGMPENAMRVVNGREMHNICMQDMVSAALVQGGLSLRELPFPEIHLNPVFSRLRERVTVGVNVELNRDQPDGRGAHVTVTVAGGRQVDCRVDHPRGHSKRGGASWSELAEKWHDGLPDRDMDRAITLARGLEGLEDIHSLVSVFRSER